MTFIATSMLNSYETSQPNFIQTAMSPEIGVIYNEILDHYFVPISREKISLKEKFHTLKAKWEEETSFLSSISEIAMHPDYQKIIGMGEQAIPFILNEMRKNPGHWFWALKSISGENPVPPELKGKIKEMTISWLQWGKNRSYIE